MKRALCMLVLGAFAFACTKPSEPGSCFRPQDNSCLEYGAAQGAAGKRLCAGLTWTPGAGSCPAAGKLGTCAKPDTSELLYSGAPNNYDRKSAQASCEHGGGTFAP